MQAGESVPEKLDWMHNKIIKTKQAGSYWWVPGEFAA